MNRDPLGGFAGKKHFPPEATLMNCLGNVNKENENKIKLYLEERC